MSRWYSSVRSFGSSVWVLLEPLGEKNGCPKWCAETIGKERETSGDLKTVVFARTSCNVDWGEKSGDLKIVVFALDVLQFRLGDKGKLGKRQANMLWKPERWAKMR